MVRYARYLYGRAVNGGQKLSADTSRWTKVCSHIRRNDPNPLRSARIEVDIGALAAKLAIDGSTSALARLSDACGSPLGWSSPAGLMPTNSCDYLRTQKCSIRRAWDGQRGPASDPSGKGWAQRRIVDTVALFAS